MGCCCAKYEVSDDRADQTTPLLNSQPISAKAAAENKSYRATDEVSAVDTLPERLVVTPVKVNTIDKRFQDQSEAYHKYLQKYQDLQAVIQELKNTYPEHNQDRSLRGCFNHIRHACDDPEAIIVLDQADCPKLDYKADRLDQSLVGPLVSFNKASNLVEYLLLKGPPLTSAVKDMTAAETDLRQDILMSSLGSEGPDCLQRCLDDVKQFQKVPNMVDTICKDTRSIAERLKRATTILKDLETGKHDAKAPAVESEVLLMKDEDKPNADMSGVDASKAEHGRDMLVPGVRSTDDNAKKKKVPTATLR